MSSNAQRSRVPAIISFIVIIGLLSVAALWVATTTGDMFPLRVRLVVAMGLIAVFILSAATLIEYLWSDRDLVRTPIGSTLASQTLEVVKMFYSTFTAFAVATLYFIAAFPAAATTTVVEPVEVGIVQESIQSNSSVVLLNSEKSVTVTEAGLTPGDQVEVFHSSWTGFTTDSDSSTGFLLLIALSAFMVFILGVLFAIALMGIVPPVNDALMRRINKSRTSVRTSSYSY